MADVTIKIDTAADLSGVVAAEKAGGKMGDALAEANRSAAAAIDTMRKSLAEAAAEGKNGEAAFSGLGGAAVKAAAGIAVLKDAPGILKSCFEWGGKFTKALNNLGVVSDKTADSVGEFFDSMTDLISDGDKFTRALEESAGAVMALFMNVEQLDAMISKAKEKDSLAKWAAASNMELKELEKTVARLDRELEDFQARQDATAKVKKAGLSEDLSGEEKARAEAGIDEEAETAKENARAEVAAAKLKLEYETRQQLRRQQMATDDKEKRAEIGKEITASRERSEEIETGDEFARRTFKTDAGVRAAEGAKAISEGRGADEEKATAEKERAAKEAEREAREAERERERNERQARTMGGGQEQSEEVTRKAGIVQLGVNQLTRAAANAPWAKGARESLTQASEALGTNGVQGGEMDSVNAALKEFLSLVKTLGQSMPEAVASLKKQIDDLKQTVQDQGR